MVAPLKNPVSATLRNCACWPAAASQGAELKGLYRRYCRSGMKGWNKRIGVTNVFARPRAVRRVSGGLARDLVSLTQLRYEE